MPSKLDQGVGYLRGAQAAALRLFTLYLGLGIVDFASSLVQGFIARNSDVHAESDLVAPLVGLMTESRLGEGWLLSFIVLLVVGTAVKVGLATWMWRTRGVSVRQPLGLLFVGAVGLLAMVAQPFAGMQASYVLARTHGAEALAAFAVALNIASIAALALNTLMLGGFFVVLFLAVQADEQAAPPPTPQAF